MEKPTVSDILDKVDAAIADLPHRTVPSYDDLRLVARVILEALLGPDEAEEEPVALDEPDPLVEAPPIEAPAPAAEAPKAE